MNKERKRKRKEDKLRNQKGGGEKKKITLSVDFTIFIHRQILFGKKSSLLSLLWVK